MKARAVRSDETDQRHVGMVVAHSVRNAAGTKFVLKKGQTLAIEHLDALHGLGSRELHLIELALGDVHEDAAGARLARAVAGSGVRIKGPAESQYTLVAEHRGLLRIDEDALCEVNSLDGVSVLTRFDRQPVDDGDALAGAKVTPFAMPRETIERAELICRERPPVLVRPFLPRRVAAVVLDRVDLRARDRFQAALERKLSWFGSELVAVGDVGGGEPDPSRAYASLLRRVLAEEPDLIMAAGASSLDPLEPLFKALDEIGARLVKHGVPVHPGSLFWLAYLGPTPLLGLSSCEMFSHKTVLDLVLPRLLVGEPLGTQELVRLGLGGMLGREMAYRFPPYGGGSPADE